MFRIIVTTSFAVLTVGLVLNFIKENSVIHSAQAQTFEEPNTDGAALRAGDRGEKVANLQRALADYGYGVAVNGSYDTMTEHVVTAFQRHFRPARVDGIADVSTVRTLEKLIARRDSAP